MQRTKAPFRADEVGSLLRPAKIKEARARLEKGEISADDLRKIEDMEIEKVVHKQASLGLKLATDGEFRRSWWHFDFLAKLTGCELFHPETGIQFASLIPVCCNTQSRFSPSMARSQNSPTKSPLGFDSDLFSWTNRIWNSLTIFSSVSLWFRT